MRVIEFMAAGRGLPDEFGGDDAEIALGHAARSLSEFAVALDAFEESGVDLDAAQQALRAASRSPPLKMIVEAEGGYRVEEKVTIPPPMFEAARYWGLRRGLHAKAAVIALEQIARALDHIAGPVAESAAKALDAAVPDLQLIRDSIAHADERVLRRAIIRRRTHDLTIQESPTLFSTLLSDRGYCEGDVFVMKVARYGGRPAIARIEISQAMLDRVHAILDGLIQAIPWRNLHDSPGPLFTPL